jgi:hypothetical protein
MLGIKTECDAGRNSKLHPSPAKAYVFTTGPLTVKNGPVWFPAWKAALTRSELTPQLKREFTHKIGVFLNYGKSQQAAAIAALAKYYLSSRETVTTGPAHEGLRWFFRAAWKDGARESAPSIATGNRAPLPAGGGRRKRSPRNTLNTRKKIAWSESLFGPGAATPATVRRKAFYPFHPCNPR